MTKTFETAIKNYLALPVDECPWDIGHLMINLIESNKCYKPLEKYLKDLDERLFEIDQTLEDDFAE